MHILSQYIQQSILGALSSAGVLCQLRSLHAIAFNQAISLHYLETLVWFESMRTSVHEIVQGLLNYWIGRSNDVETESATTLCLV